MLWYKVGDLVQMDTPYCPQLNNCLGKIVSILKEGEVIRIEDGVEVKRQHMIFEVLIPELGNYFPGPEDIKHIDTDKTKIEMIKKEYIYNNGLICPNCGEDDTSGNIKHIDKVQYPDRIARIQARTLSAGELLVDMKCLSCKHTWVENYKLTGYRGLKKCLK